ncbi:MAG: hypothetical protein PHI48_09230 [Bacteroidales bacterium]|nr:hypothetical protein [Bacteroidales bacterium]MDD4822723.1 hypothetical protein [Bacteroidales bacterium]
MKNNPKYYLLLLLVTLFSCKTVYYPQRSWEVDRRGAQDSMLIALANDIQGDGCIVKQGKILLSWGKIDRPRDWASASKPILSTLLFFAIDEGGVKSVNDRLTEYGIPLSEKDSDLSFLHLGAMTSGYTLNELAGEAFAYNDYGIQLYQKALFDYVYKKDPTMVTTSHFDAISPEDGFLYYKRRVSLSVRDYARIVWLWRNEGKWNDKQVISRKLFARYMRPQVPYDLPHASPCERIDDYLGIGSYGGGADHFTQYGPGVYGFNWWFNKPTLLHKGERLFPSLPDDLIMAVGVRGHLALFSPKRDYILVSSFGNWGAMGEDWSKAETLIKRFLECMKNYE